MDENGINWSNFAAWLADLVDQVQLVKDGTAIAHRNSINYGIFQTRTPTRIV